MALLNTLFHSPASLAKNAAKADDKIQAAWTKYYETIPAKEKVIARLPSSFGQRKQLLQELQRLLKLELIDVQRVEKDEREVIDDLHSLDHTTRIQQIHRLEEALCYAETKYQYIYNLLLHLYVNLRKEAALCKKLAKITQFRSYRQQVELLQAELQVELTIIEKIEARENFHQLLLALVKGEEIIEQLTAKEKKMVQKMRGNNPTGGITDQWVMGVFNALEENIHEAVLTDNLEDHTLRDFEFVNRSLFVELARKVIEELRGRKVSSELLNSFVHMFREKYNDER